MAAGFGDLLSALGIWLSGRRASAPAIAVDPITISDSNAPLVSLSPGTDIPIVGIVTFVAPYVQITRQ